MKFLTRKGCHLCDDARDLLLEVARKKNVLIEEVDIDTDDELVKLYGIRIPVILGDHGQVLAEGVIDHPRLLQEALDRVSY